MKSLEDTLAAITSGVRGAIDWVDAASICMAYEWGLDTLGATDPLPHKAEAAQYELSEGPSVAVTLSTPIVHSADVAHDERWPNYALVAAELGVRSQAGVLVHTRRSQVTVLNLYSRSGRDLDPVDSDLASIFAEQAATAIDCAARVETLTDAVGNTSVISQAIGIVMERFELNEARAFEYLVRVSQTSQTKLRLIAAELVAGANARDDGIRP